MGARGGRNTRHGCVNRWAEKKGGKMRESGEEFDNLIASYTDNQTQLRMPLNDFLIYCRLFTTNEEEKMRNLKKKSMNERTTTCSKQLQTDLQTAREFWPPAKQAPIVPRHQIYPSRESNSDRNKLTKQIAHVNRLLCI